MLRVDRLVWIVIASFVTKDLGELLHSTQHLKWIHLFLSFHVQFILEQRVDLWPTFNFIADPMHMVDLDRTLGLHQLVAVAIDSNLQ